MTIAHLLNSLFNLGAQTDYLNSSDAARLFWMGAIVAIAAAIAIGIAVGSRRHRSPRLRHH
jgi:hypothetical protein